MCQILALTSSARHGVNVKEYKMTSGQLMREWNENKHEGRHRMMGEEVHNEDEVDPWQWNKNWPAAFIVCPLEQRRACSCLAIRPNGDCWRFLMRGSVLYIACMTGRKNNFGALVFKYILVLMPLLHGTTCTFTIAYYLGAWERKCFCALFLCFCAALPCRQR